MTSHVRSFVLCLLLGIAVPAGAQQLTAAAIVDSARREIDAASAAGDGVRLDRVLALLERGATAYPKDAWIAHYLGFAYYRASHVARATKGSTRVKPFLEQADKSLERSVGLLEIAETHALRSAVLGEMIAESGNPITGMRLGPKADKEMDRALALGARNPRVWAIRASGVLHKPKLFGGSVTKAEEYARTAIGFMADDHPASPAPVWGEGDAYTFLGQALAGQKKYAEAKVAYDHALRVEPGNSYVKLVLYPALPAALRDK